MQAPTGAAAQKNKPKAKGKQPVITQRVVSATTGTQKGKQGQNKNRSKQEGDVVQKDPTGILEAKRKALLKSKFKLNVKSKQAQTPSLRIDGFIKPLTSEEVRLAPLDAHSS